MSNPSEDMRVAKALRCTVFYLFSRPSLLLFHLLFFLLSVLLFVLHAAMQSSLLCRQNCRDSHLPFLFLVLSIHLPVSSGAERASSVPSAHCRTRLLWACALTLLIPDCVCMCACTVYVRVLCLIPTQLTLPFSPSLSFFFSSCCCDFADLLKVTGK